MPPPIRLLSPRSASFALRALNPTSSSSRLSQLNRPNTSPTLQRTFHASPARPRRAHNNETIPDQPPTTDFARMDVLGQTPAPATSIDATLPDGFVLGDGSVTITSGSGALLVAGEAFAWRPWNAQSKRLVNAKGQWDLEEAELEAAFGLLGMVWPRPDLLILGLGPAMRPISARVRRHISGLGIRVEVADTRNAASQYNLLATERGVNQVAAALIPMGWREGRGAES